MLALLLAAIEKERRRQEAEGTLAANDCSAENVPGLGRTSDDSSKT